MQKKVFHALNGFCKAVFHSHPFCWSREVKKVFFNVCKNEIKRIYSDEIVHVKSCLFSLESF